MVFTCVDPTATVGVCRAYGAPGCIAVDVQNTVTHEIGHALGLDDEYTDPVPTMYGTAAFGDVEKRSLSPDDVAAMCAIYPRGAATPSCIAPTAPARGGCATEGVPGGVLLGLAAFAARRLWCAATRARRSPMP